MRNVLSAFVTSFMLHVKLIDGNMIMANISRPDESFLEEVGKTVYLELPYKAVMFFEKDSGLRC